MENQQIITDRNSIDNNEQIRNDIESKPDFGLDENNISKIAKTESQDHSNVL